MALPHRSIAIFSIALCAQWMGAAAANAAETWRCGNTYTDQPCAGGKAIDADDARNPTQVRAAEAATRREQAAGDRMARERQRQEAIAARQGPALIDARPRITAPAKATASPKKKKGSKKEPEFFTAHDAQKADAGDKSSGKKKKKKNADG